MFGYSWKSCTIDAATGAWTCPSLDFYDAVSDHINYSLQNGSLVETVGSSTQTVTGDTVAVKYLSFRLYGQTEGDNWPPRITISIGIAPSSSDPAVSSDVINLQTSVSARTIDCVPNSSPVQC